jgi:hypothetical protein
LEVLPESVRPGHPVELKPVRKRIDGVKAKNETVTGFPARVCSRARKFYAYLSLDVMDARLFLHLLLKIHVTPIPMKTPLFILTALLGVLLSSEAQIPSYVPSNGLVGWWSFTGNANDDSPNANHGTVLGAWLCPDRFGQDSSAYYFGGGNQQIQWANDTLLTNHTDLTASVWFQVENRISGWDQNVIVSNIGTWHSSGGFEILTGNPPGATLTGMFRNATFYDQVVQAPGTVTIDTGQWNHVVYTLEYSPVLDSTLVSIFLNDTLVIQQHQPQSIVYSFITPFMVGDNIDSAGYQRAFKGKIDDIGLWNRALSLAEIHGLYQVATGIPDISSRNSLKIAPNPAGSWLHVEVPRFEKNVSYRLTDLTGRVVLTGLLYEKSSVLELNSVCPGAYLFSVDDSRYPAIKIMKLHD